MKQRMSLLLENNVISKVAFSSTMNAVDILKKEWGVEESSEQFQMAMTHFARAIDRVRQNTPVEKGLDAGFRTEMENDELFPEIISMNHRLCAFEGIPTMPETENSFLLSNLYAIKLSMS